jgi:malate dehydrogenase
VIEFPMDANEKEMWAKSIAAVNGLLAACKEIDPSLA